MPTILYCWRCRIDVPMLSDSEFDQLNVDGGKYVRELRDQRELTGLSRADLFNSGWLPSILVDYKRLTGVHETNFNSIWHHKTSIYGPPCIHCGKVLRTPQASFCFLCHRDQIGTIATDSQSPKTL
jgi:hypothetical protein